MRKDLKLQLSEGGELQGIVAALSWALQTLAWQMACTTPEPKNFLRQFVNAVRIPDEVVRRMLAAGRKPEMVVAWAMTRNKIAEEFEDDEDDDDGAADSE